MKKIKVAFFAESLLEDFDGAVRTMYQIINRIPNHEFEYLFFTGEKPSKDFSHRVVEIPNMKLPINHNYKMALSFLVTRKLEKELADFRPDVIHIATPSSLGNFAVNYANRLGIPSISIYHTHFLSYVDYYFEKLPFLIPAARNYMISMMQSFYNKCDMVYVPTNKMKTVLSQIGVFSSHVKIWKRGLPPNLFSPDKRDDFYLKSITGNKKKNILFASRLVWEKNIKTLIEIYKLDQAKDQAYNFIVCGEGYSKDKMKEEMPNAYFLGNLSHEGLSTVYASSDLFLFPSISETYGNVVAEAMASGTPCVIGNGGGTVEFIENGYNGFKCEANNAEDYLSRIEEVFSKPKLKEQFIDRSLEMTATLCWEDLTQQYFNDIRSFGKFKYLKIA